MTGAVLWVVALRHASRDTFPPRALSEKCPWEPPNHPPGSAAPSSPSKLGFPSAGGAGPSCFTFPLLPSLSSPCAHPAWPRRPLGMVRAAWSCWLGTRAGDPTASHAGLEIPSCHPLVLEAAQKTPLFGAGCFSPSVPRLCLAVPTLFHRTGRVHCMSQLLLEAFPLTLRSVFGVIIPISCDFSPFSPVLFLTGRPLAAQLLLISSILLRPLQGRLRRLSQARLLSAPFRWATMPN